MEPFRSQRRFAGLFVAALQGACCSLAAAASPGAGATDVAIAACASDACEAEGLGGLSMLQFSASPWSAGAAAAAPSASPMPELQSFRGVKMLIAQLPVSRALAEREATHKLFGEEKAATGDDLITLDREGFAQLSVAFFPDAPISWTGVPGESPIQNLPHHLLQVRLPIIVGGQKMYQSAYALTDDDRAMMLYRFGSGIPAKVANFSFPPTGASHEPQDINVTRRGLKVLRASQIRGEGEGTVEAKEVAQLLETPDMNWWTPMSNYVPIGSREMKFEHRVTKANITSAKRIQVSLAVEPSDFDPLYWVFAELTPLEAYWIEADLDVTTTSIPAANPTHLAIGAVVDKRISALRVGGIPREDADFSMAQMRGQCNDAATIWATMRLNPDKVKPRLLPGMSLASDTGLLLVQRCRPFATPVLDVVLPLLFEEVWVSVPVRFGDTTYQFPLLLLANDDVGMMAGQDYGGLPKKLSNVTLEMSPPVAAGEIPGSGTSVSWSAERHGHAVVKFTGRLTTETTKRVPGVNGLNGDGSRWALIEGHQFPRNPSFDSPFCLFMRSIETTTAQREMVDMTVELGTHDQEPLGDWFQGAPLQGGFVQMSRDWIPLGGDLRDEFKQLPANEYVSWWKRNFQLLYL